MEKALGDNKFSVRLGDEREEIMSYYEIVHAANKKFDDGSQYWECWDTAGDMVGGKRTQSRTRQYAGLESKKINRTGKVFCVGLRCGKVNRIGMVSMPDWCFGNSRRL